MCTKTDQGTINVRRTKSKVHDTIYLSETTIYSINQESNQIQKDLKILNNGCT